jgi:hypothetical protein
MPYQALSVEEVTCISSRMRATNLPSNTILAGTVSSLIQTWNDLNGRGVPRPRSSSLQNLTTTHRDRRASLAAGNEFPGANSITDSPKREKSNSPTPKLESLTSTCSRLERHDHTPPKEKSPVSTTSKRDSPVSTLPKSPASVAGPPEGESPCATAGERWHGKSWVKRDFVDGKNGDWTRPTPDARTPSITPARATRTEEEELKAEEPTTVDPWSPLAGGDNRTGLRRRPSTRHPAEQRRCLPESWYRSPHRDEDDISSVVNSNEHLEKLKAISRKHGLDYEPAEENTHRSMKREQLQHKIHVRSQRRCHRCGETYNFYNICLRCGHKCCRECPRSPSGRSGEERWATTGSCSAQEERKSSSLLPMLRAASSYAGSISRESDDDAEDRSAYIEALIDDIDNAITIASRRYDSSRRAGSRGEDSEDAETVVEVGQKQASPTGGFPGSPKEGDDANSLREKDVRIPATGYNRILVNPEEDFLSPDDRSVTRELNENSRSSPSTSPPSPPQSSHSSCSSSFRSSLTACSGQNRGRTHGHIKQKLRHHHAVPHHRYQPRCHGCSLYAADPCRRRHECPAPAAPRDGSSRSSSRRSQNTSTAQTHGYRDESSDWGHCSQPTQQQCCRSQRHRCQTLCNCCYSHCGEGWCRHGSYHRSHRSRVSCTRPFILALYLTNEVIPPRKLPVQPLVTPTPAAAQPQPPSAGPSARWAVPTDSPRRPKHGHHSVGPAAGSPQSRPWRVQQPTPGKIPGHPQQSKSLPMTRKTGTALPDTRRGSIAATTVDKPPREAIKQGSVPARARARAWEQSTAAVMGTPPLSTTQDKGKKGEQEGRLGSADSLASKVGIKGQATDDDASDQTGASPRGGWQGSEGNSISRIRVVVEVIGDGDKDCGREVEQGEARGRKGKKWMVEFDVGLDVEVGCL